jgi:DNA-binding transcriptional ArsR family regulator
MDFEKYKDFVILRVLKAVSSETRLEIIKLLFKEKSMSETELSEALNSSLANISFHISKLKTARFVIITKHVNERYVSIVKDRNLELNYNILQLLEKWFAKKEGDKKKYEEAFIENILHPGKMSNLKKFFNAIDERDEQKQKKKQNKQSK